MNDLVESGYKLANWNVVSGKYSAQAVALFYLPEGEEESRG